MTFCRQSRSAQVVNMQHPLRTPEAVEGDFACKGTCAKARSLAGRPIWRSRWHPALSGLGTCMQSRLPPRVKVLCATACKPVATRFATQAGATLTKHAHPQGHVAWCLSQGLPRDVTPVMLQIPHGTIKGSIYGYTKWQTYL